MKKEFSILVAEDDLGHFTLIKRNLQRLGFESRILHFLDGQEILDFLFKGNDDGRKEDEIYLILLDIRMPKVDGIRVLERIKEDENLSRMPTIMLTSSDDPQEISRCKELGCDDYIIKPIEYEGFADTIQKVADSLLYSLIRISGPAGGD